MVTTKANHQMTLNVKEAAAIGQRPAYGLESVARSQNLTESNLSNKIRPAGTHVESDLYLGAEDFTALVGGDGVRL